MDQHEVEIQKNNILKGNPLVNLLSPCRIDSGILQLDEEDQSRLAKAGRKTEKKITFFIPASGSGSRMFQFLFDFLVKNDNADQGSVQHCLNQLEDFAFSRFLPAEMQAEVKSGVYEPGKLITYILGPKGLGLADKPKGLVPFHQVKAFVLNAFQEQYIQAAQLMNASGEIHFTVQEDFLKDIELTIRQIQDFTGLKLKATFSFQDSGKAAFAFDKEMNVAIDDNGINIRRPSGHGALIENINSLNSDYIFIKNIDNVQHLDKSHSSKETWMQLVGLIEEVKLEIENLLLEFSTDKAILFNDKYQLYQKTCFAELTNEEKIKLLQRPLRVCGMVKNIGQPGGGPYWVEKNGVISKQIVEKSQMQNTAEQQALVLKSTHFNPVMMVVSSKDRNNNKIDFNQFVDHKKYFIVNKSHEGKEIVYRELPGLWNGGMDQWNTIFIEVSSDTFSPVKSIMDLLTPQHRPNL